MFHRSRRLVFLLAFAVATIPADTEAVKKAAGGVADLGHGTRAILWRDPVDVASLNMRYGLGGEEHQPRGPFTFIEEDLEGTNPKFDVSDRDGVKWKVKMGAEARPEVAASRFVWAAGYFTHESYFLEELRVQGMPRRLQRGQDLVGRDGTVRDVRLKRSVKGEEKLGTWKWAENPFIGTREFNGLRVVMALINNWDLKDTNNAVTLAKPKEGSADVDQIYRISDLGATFGSSGYKLSREASRGNLEAYKRSKFIGERSDAEVDFKAPGRPALIETLNLPLFLRRIDMQWIGRDVPRADAKWLGEILSRLSPGQIQDAFRAAGYSPQVAAEFAAVIQARVAELNAL